MIRRPADDTGDMLPVLSPDALLRGAPAVARLAEDRLNLLAGEWWENPSRGNAALDMLRASRLTEAGAGALANYLSAFLRETPGVQDVRDAAFRAEGRRFSYSCTVATEDGSAEIRYDVPF